MREILQRMLAVPEPPRSFCRVESVLPDGRYTVLDDHDQGRRWIVDGDAGYKPGILVMVQSGRIVGVGSRAAIKTTYRV